MNKEKNDFIANTSINHSLNHDSNGTEQYYRDSIKQAIIKPFIHNTSILQTPRSGIDYSMNGESGKPFEGVQQLFLQQIRKNKHYQSPYFLSITDSEKYGFPLKPDEEGYILSYVNKQNQKIEYDFFYNGDQFTTLNSSINTSLLNKPEIPYLINKKAIPTPVEYKPQNALFNETFKWNIQNYFNSIYFGIEFTPPEYADAEKKKIIFNAFHEQSTFFRDVKTIHKDIERYLMQSNKQKRERNHARGR
jgi:hypothetical protein